MHEHPACFRINVSDEMDPYFQEDSIPADGIPRCVILTGPPATGKTTVRKERYGTGYVLVDAVPTC